MTAHHKCLLATTLVAWLLLSCASAPRNPKGLTASATPQSVSVLTQKRVVTVKPSALPSLPQSVPTQNPVPTQNHASRQYQSFEEWKSDFVGRQSQHQTLFANAHLNSQVINLDANQAEFAQLPWQYLDGRVTDSKVNQARQKRREMLSVLDAAESRYGVPASVVTAIWGLESGFGVNMGSTNLVSALASLAYEGRRRDFAESQLLAMGAMLERGDVGIDGFVGSWAGGMGHTQFIPTTWMKYAVDGDNDGVLSPFSSADALHSTARYLSSSGWVQGLPAYIEVSLPQNFDYRYLGGKQSLDAWRAMGLQGDELSGNQMAQLFLPAGIQGPKLLTTQNFEVIKVYNNSTNYALSVALLANKMNGKQGLVAPFPRHERALSKQQVRRLQELLNAQGYNAGTADGVIGTKTRQAFAQWQLANGQIPDGFITQASSARLLY